MKKKILKVVNDQIGVPTSPYLISKVTCEAIKSIHENKNWENGIYNLTPTGSTTWYQIAKKIISLALLKKLPILLEIENLFPISSLEFKTSAKRPLNSLLDTSKISKNLSFSLPSWEDDFNNTVNNLINGYKN